MTLSIERTEARAALTAAWQVRARVAEARRTPVEAMLRRVGGALEGEVPPLRAAHVFPLDVLGDDAHQGESADEVEAWGIVINALAAGIAHLFRREEPREHATLKWLGLLDIGGADARAVVTRAERLLGRLSDVDTLDDDGPTFRGTLEDPYDDALLSLVPYLKDQAREEECQALVGPAEAAMALGPEPVTGSREALGLSFLRWRLGEDGIEARVQCRVHALSHEAWILVVPDAVRARRQLVRAFLFGFREAVQNGPALDGLKHLRPPSPQAIAQLSLRLFAPSALADLPSGEALDFEQRLAEPRFLGGVVPELEEHWPSSPFRRVVREAGSVRRAMELVAPTILEVAAERYGGDLSIDLDEYEEVFTIRRRRVVVSEVTDPTTQLAATDRDAQGARVGEVVSTVLEMVLSERWQP